MSTLLWSIKNLLVRQPIYGTGKCIQRYVDSNLWLPDRPVAGDTLRVHARAHAKPIRIKIDAVEMNAVSNQKDCHLMENGRDLKAGELICKSMALLPLNEKPDDLEVEFYQSLSAMGSKRTPVTSSEIVSIEYGKWLLDGCIDDVPEERWFDGMEDGQGYSVELILTKEGRRQFETAKGQLHLFQKQNIRKA